MITNPFNARMASLVLVIGIFFAISCATTGSTDREAPEQNRSTSLENELERINNDLADNPGNEELILQKAELLDNLAQSYSEPEPRAPFYKNLRDLADGPGISGSDRESELNNVLARSWNREQSSGVKLLQDTDEDLPQNQYDRIIAHLNNATAIMPDSTVTYTLLATTYYRSGHVNNAINTLTKANQVEDGNAPQIQEKLAYLYLETGEIDQSIQIYESLTENNPDDPYLRHGLANAYILNEQHHDAVSQLRLLTEDYPTRYTYLESLSTELFFIFQEEVQHFTNAQNGSSATDEQIQTAIGYLEEIDSIFDTLTERLPQSEEILFRMASTYKNASILLSDLMPYLDESLQDYLAHFPDEYLEKSISHWERLIELNPDNSDYYNNLYQVYVRLNMDEEAESIERAFNF